MDLPEITPGELKRAVDKGIPPQIPAGCLEYHGNHLPLGTDTITAEEIVRRVARQTACVSPGLQYSLPIILAEAFGTARSKCRRRNFFMN
jgi:creatinine amidohydrolase/Fe(II)-dependent formamide hydrolase-like protein